MARLIWRKQNLGTLRIAERAQMVGASIDAKLNVRFSIETVLEGGKTRRNMRAAEDQVRKELGDTHELVEIGDVATIDGLTRELDVKDRLDALVDKSVKRLLLVKGLKSVSTAPSSASPQRVLGPSKAA